MNNNFNLRNFLVENKLTKAAAILSEQLDLTEKVHTVLLRLDPKELYKVSWIENHKDGKQYRGGMVDYPDRVTKFIRDLLNQDALQDISRDKEHIHLVFDADKFSPSKKLDEVTNYGNSNVFGNADLNDAFKGEVDYDEVWTARDVLKKFGTDTDQHLNYPSKNVNVVKFYGKIEDRPEVFEDIKEYCTDKGYVVHIEDGEDWSGYNKYDTVYVGVKKLPGKPKDLTENVDGSEYKQWTEEDIEDIGEYLEAKNITDHLYRDTNYGDVDYRILDSKRSLQLIFDSEEDAESFSDALYNAVGDVYEIFRATVDHTILYIRMPAEL